jgi:hypothetical protein
MILNERFSYTYNFNGNHSYFIVVKKKKQAQHVFELKSILVRSQT